MKKGQRANQRLDEGFHERAALVGSMSFFNFSSERGGGAIKKTCTNMIEGLLILILFLIGTCFCSADLRYLTLRARVGILACKIFIYLQILFFSCLPHSFILYLQD